MIDRSKWAIRLALGAVAVLAFIMALNLTGWKWDPLNRAEADKEGRAVAEDHIESYERASEADARALDNHREIDAIAQEATHEVRQIPGAETPVDPARREPLCAQLAGVSDYDVCTD